MAPVVMREETIRPARLFAEYLRLSAADAAQCFAGHVRHHVPCPACGAAERSSAFSKEGFAYQTCAACGSLYQSPRYDRNAYATFYRDSASARYWATTFFPAVADVRRETIFRPRVERLSALCAARGVQPRTVADIGAGYGLFLDEWRRRYSETRAIAIEPSVDLARTCRGYGFEVIEAMAEDVPAHAVAADLLTCFELLEHVVDPLAFLRAFARLVRPGGLICCTTLGVDGFDIQVLWERSKSVSPPHHINFCSRVGFERLFMRAGFTDVDVITPGVLDVDIVRNALRDDPDAVGNRFLARLVQDDATATAFQALLTAHRLSSHTWVLARAPRVP